MASREATPPADNSIAARARALTVQSPGTLGFMKQVTMIVLAQVGCTILSAFTLIIPATMITIGALYLGFCRAEPYIPIYLVVAGCFSALRILMGIARTCFLDEAVEGKRVEVRKVERIVEMVVDVFQCAWFIAGNVWVYRTHGDFSSDPTVENYCEPTCYWFAFWVISATYILCGSACCCFGVCAIGFSCCYTRTQRHLREF